MKNKRKKVWRIKGKLIEFYDIIVLAAFSTAAPDNYNSSVSLAALSDTKSDIPSCPKTHVWPRKVQ